MPGGKRQRVFRVFYRDYANDVSVSSASPEGLLADRIAPLAEVLLRHADNFIGVVDANERILQLYRDDDPSRVTAELLYPENGGVLRLGMSRAQAMALLADLPESFTEGLLPGATVLS